MNPRMKLFIGLYVWNIVLNVSCKNTTRMAIPKNSCAQPWKSDFGLAKNTTQLHRRSLSGLQNVINGFLSGQVDDSIKIHLEKCTKSTNCRLSAILDKQKIDVMFLCIEVNDSEICYTSKCVCQKKKRKRAITFGLNLSMNGDEDKIDVRNNYEPRCEFEKSKNKYSHHKTVTSCNCQNVTCRGLDIKKGLDEEITVAKEEYLYKNSRNKETNMAIFILCFLGGTLLGLIIGVFVTHTYFRRKSKQTKVLSVRNMVYNQNRTSDEEIALKEIGEYSEIPDNHENIEVEETLPQEEKTKNSDEQQSSEGSENRQYVNLHTSPCMIVQEDTYEPCFEDNLYPQQILNDSVSGEYLEPTTHNYHTLCQVRSDLEVIKKNAVKDDLKEKEENRHDNGKAVNQSDVQIENALVHHYNILSKCSSVNRGIYSLQERKDETSDLCNLKKECSAKEPAYFVLSAVKDPASPTIARKDADTVPNISPG